jgi:hypothetical protein
MAPCFAVQRRILLAGTFAGILLSVPALASNRLQPRRLPQRYRLRHKLCRQARR